MMIRPYRHIKHANANERPLFIIDGKSVDPEEFEAISADSVFSFSILKEHSAIARYGEKGRKGVIEVTTKRGKAQEK